MSSTLCWEPVHRKKKDLPDELKYVLQKKEGGTVDTVMGIGEISYLKALSDVGVEGASDLIEAIEKHDQVHLREEF